ncbi:MAG: hypothetical protein K0R54_4315 [Clostridiaceae bacterium]|jgi:hypothetical protein|nr:hypothetical protein [Clostridiaceae bacterium]
MLRLKMKDFKINKDLIKADLSVYINYAKNTFILNSQSMILNKFMSIEDYIYILYYLRFEKQLDYTEIGKILYPNKKGFHNNAYNAYLAIGLNYSTNYEETKERFICEQKRLKEIREKSYKVSINEFNLTQIKINEYNTLFEKFKKKFLDNIITPITYKRYGYDNLSDYFKAFYYFTNICELSPVQISHMFGRSYSTINEKLRQMGLEKDMKTAQKNAVKHNRRNYKNTLVAGRKTVNKYLAKNALVGSILENAIRNSFADYLAGYINTSKYEVVVGINNKTIIAPKEVDIPIIIMDEMNSKIHKFGIEVNGDIFHKDKAREEKKIKLLKDKNWIYYPIWNTNRAKDQENIYGTIENQINQICNNIKNIV